MKKLLIACLMFFAYGANAAEYFDTEKRLYFSVEVVQRAIVDHVPEKNQVAVSTLYDGLIGKEGTEEEGKVSVADLFRVCEAAGFNTRKYEGFSLCKSFIQQMLIDAGKVQCGILQEQMLADIDIEQCLDLGGFCPKNVTHGLRSINHETRIGDFCSSSNIRGGQVIFRKNFESCTCEAYMCNPGYIFEGGACKSPQPEAKDVACEREAWPKTNENNYYAKCKEFCAKKYAGKGCKYTSVVMSHSTNQCICNADSDEVNAALESMRQAKEKQIKNLKYYNVCGKDKGKTGGTEKCVEDFADGGLLEFKWGAKVTVAQAVVLAKEWARIKNNDSDIVCNENFVNCKNNDDCMQCTSLSKNNFYEFRFGSLEELNDLELQKSIVRSVCTLYGLNYFDGTFRVEDLHNVYYSKCTDASKDKCMNVHSTMMAFGYTAEFEGRGSSGICKINFGSKNSSSALNRYGNLDNFVFCDGIQLSQSNTIDKFIKDWVVNQGVSVQSFSCNSGTNIYTGEGCKADSTNHDEILTCYINGKPMDFVFDDLNDDLQRKHNSGMQQMSCLASGGQYHGEKCFLPGKEACDKMREVNQIACPKCSAVQWDATNNVCVMPDKGFNDKVDLAVQIGTSVALAAMTLVPGANVAAGQMLVSFTINILPDVLSEGSRIYISNVMDKFFIESKQCNNSGCATDKFQKNFQRIMNFIKGGSLTPNEEKMADEEMARLAGLADDSFIEKFVGNYIDKTSNCLQSAENLSNCFVTRFDPAQFVAGIGTALSFVDIEPRNLKVGMNTMANTYNSIGERVSKLMGDSTKKTKIKQIVGLVNDGVTLQGQVEAVGEMSRNVEGVAQEQIASSNMVQAAVSVGTSGAMLGVVDGAQKD